MIASSSPAVFPKDIIISIMRELPLRDVVKCRSLHSIWRAAADIMIQEKSNYLLREDYETLKPLLTRITEGNRYRFEPKGMTNPLLLTLLYQVDLTSCYSLWDKSLFSDLNEARINMVCFHALLRGRRFFLDGLKKDYEFHDYGLFKEVKENLKKRVTERFKHIFTQLHLQPNHDFGTSVTSVRELLIPFLTNPTQINAINSLYLGLCDVYIYQRYPPDMQSRNLFYLKLSTSIPMGAYHYGQFWEYTECIMGNAIHYYRLAAAQNFPPAQYALGRILHETKGNTVEIFDMIESAAKQNYIPAIDLLGLFYLEGTHVIQNKEEAIKWFKKGVEFDSPFCQAVVAQELIKQNKDLHIAFSLAKKSAARINDRGNYLLGRMYEKGIGVAIDEQEASRYYKLSMEQGLKTAFESYYKTAKESYYRLNPTDISGWIKSFF